VTLHGDEVHYVKVGRGPVLVLIHGILGSRRDWEQLVSLLERDFTVVAPDLLGHGDSAKPRGDYTLGGHAGRLRDLLDLLGVRRATLVGHSLGGGVALQFAWLFPERCERLVLVSSGGLGRDISRILRAPTLPGAEWVLPLISAPWLLRRGERLAGALERLPALTGIPTLLVWGARDRLIPVEHAIAAHRAIPGSRLEVFENAGHSPQLSDPTRFAALLREFVAPPRRPRPPEAPRCQAERPASGPAQRRRPGPQAQRRHRQDHQPKGEVPELERRRHVADQQQLERDPADQHAADGYMGQGGPWPAPHLAQQRNGGHDAVGDQQSDARQHPGVERQARQPLGRQEVVGLDQGHHQGAPVGPDGQQRLQHHQHPRGCSPRHGNHLLWWTAPSIAASSPQVQGRRSRRSRVACPSRRPRQQRDAGLASDLPSVFEVSTP
jgi:pimeloyl-ACP methyl ester carboxylesterase